MSEQPFAEATVRVTPSLTKFVSTLEEDLKKKMAKVKVPPIRVAPALQIGFIGNLKTQVNTAIDSVQKQIKPIRVRVLIETPSRRALRDIVSGAPVSLPGAVSGGQVVRQAENERLLNSLRAQGAHDFGLLAEAEDKATKVREKSTGASKQLATQEQKTARSLELVAEVRKRSNLIDIRAATKTGELATAQAALTEATKLAELADEARVLDVTKETVALQKAAHAERALRFERVESLKAAGAQAGAAGRTGLARGVQTARARGFGDLTSAVTGLREADVAFAATGKSVKDLAAQEAILTTRSDALKASKLAVAQALKAESSTLLVATQNTLKKAEADVLASKAAVKGINDQIALEKKLAAARAASLRQQQQAAARQATTEKRRSEQLSRGGQASILSLAGIRGATLAASRSFLVGAAAITVFANAVRQFADLERNLHVFEATTSATEEQMEAVREEARLLGADLTLPSVTAEEAAGAMVELAKAGLTVEDSINAARAVLELATAAAIDNAEATRLVANVLNAFSLAGTEATAVADTLANAANAAQGSIADIGTAFQQAASAGRQVGLSFQDTATFLTILARNGIRGSDAGTSLRTALIRLINPSQKAKERFQELGLSIHDAAGNLRPDIFLQIAAATREMSPAARDATIALIGGQDAFRAVTILGRQSVDTFLELRKQLREEGTAAELAAARTRGLHGSIDALQSVLETVGTTMASHVGPGIASFVYQLGRGVTAMSESDQVATALEESLSAVATSFDLVGDAIQLVGVVALPTANALLAITNAVSPTALLGGFVAFRTLNALLDGALFRLRALKPLFGAIAAARFGAGLQSSMAALNAAQLAAQPAVTGFARLTQVQQQLAANAAVAAPRVSTLGVALRGVGQAAVAALASTTALTLGLAAVAAAAVYFATRESASEKATRKFKEATDELITSLGERNRLVRESRDAPLQVNQAQLGVFEAQAAAARARGALSTSNAARGTFERTKLELQLRVALDDVTIAQNAYSDAVERADEAERLALQAKRNAQEAREEEIKAIFDLVKAETRRAGVASSGGRADAQAGLIRAIATRRITDALQEQIDTARELNTVESLAQAERLELLQSISRALNEIPTEHAIEIALEAPNIAAVRTGLVREFGIAGTESAQVWLDSVNGTLARQAQHGFRDAIATIQSSLGTLLGESTGDAFTRGMANGIAAGTDRVTAAAKNLGAAFKAALARSEIRQAQLEVEEDLATIASGATGATLGVKQQRLAQARSDRARAEARIAQLEREGRITGLKTARNARARAIAEEARLVEEIRGINEQLANDAESAAKEAEKKQNDRFENILKAMGLKRDARQQAIEDAQLSEGLADDIAATQKLRRLAKQQIENLKDRIDAAKKQGKNVEVLTDALADLKDVWRDLGREIIDLQREQREALRDILFERFELKIQIAQARGNVAAELRARRARLAELTKELVRMRKQFGKNSIEWLRAKAAQVEEISAIKELEKSTQDKNNALRQLMFEFLTTQQGFAANLLGNLLPIGAIGGVVAGRLAARGGGGGGGGGGTGGGAGAPALAGLQSFGGAAAAAAVAARGARASFATAGAGAIAAPTRGQHATTNQLLNQILQVLRHGNERAKHPSSRKSEKKNSAVQDGIGGV